MISSIVTQSVPQFKAGILILMVIGGIAGGIPSLGFSTRFFQNYILIDVIQVSINAGFFCCLKI